MTVDERVFQYSFGLDATDFDDWTEITGRHWSTPYGQDVDLALAKLRGGFFAKPS